MYFCCRLEAGDRLCYLSDQWVFSSVSLYLYFVPVPTLGEVAYCSFFWAFLPLLVWFACLFACLLPAASVLAFFGLVGRV